MYRKWLNQELMGNHFITCFRSATDLTCVFNMACACACECDRTPFPSMLAANERTNIWWRNINVIVSMVCINVVIFSKQFKMYIKRNRHSIEPWLSYTGKSPSKCTIRFIYFSSLFSFVKLGMNENEEMFIKTVSMKLGCQ